MGQHAHDADAEVLERPAHRTGTPLRPGTPARSTRTYGLWRPAAGVLALGAAAAGVAGVSPLVPALVGVGAAAVWAVAAAPLRFRANRYPGTAAVAAGAVAVTALVGQPGSLADSGPALAACLASLVLAGAAHAVPSRWHRLRAASA